MVRIVTQVTLFAAAALSVASTAATAQSYPNRPVQMIVPMAPGASTDIVARALERKVSADLGQTILVENRPGAGGNIGMGAVARAAPDGYVLGIATAGVLAVNTHLRQMPFNPLKDLVPVTLVAKAAFVLAAWPNGPTKSVADVIKVAKETPDKLALGHGGNGSAMHLTAALFLQRAQVKIPLVAYRGNALSTADVLGGHVPLAMTDLPSAQQHILDGKLLGLAVTSLKRQPTLPNVPTMAEAGLDGYEAVGWFGLVAPKGTPARVVTKLNKAFTKALKDPEVVRLMASVGTEPAPTTPEGFAAYIRSENAKWGKVVAEAGVKE